MNHVIHSDKAIPYLELTDRSFKLYSEQDALDLAALCSENGTSRLLVYSDNIGEDFFNLSSGLAGSVLQKFSNYRISCAVVIPLEKLTGRFREMVIEANRGGQFRFFTNPA